MLGAHGDIAPAYVGRFAPSPTGPLHFGSAITAIGSYLCARAVGGRWHVRIDDIDPARELPVASGSILRTLARLGLDWDGPVSYQSTRPHWMRIMHCLMRYSSNLLLSYTIVEAHTLKRYEYKRIHDL